MEIKKILDNLYEGTPADGMHLTQKHLAEGENRSFCCSVFEFSYMDVVDKWEEWTEAQKEEWEEEHRDPKE